MLVGTLDDVAAVREQMRGSGYDPVVARMPRRVRKPSAS